MYAISSALSRKLIGTSTRPEPLTPKSDVNSRAEFCDTIATRSPAPMPSASRPAACARARPAISRHVPEPHDAAGWSGSSTTPMRSPYTSSARSMKSLTVSGTRIEQLLFVDHSRSGIRHCVMIDDGRATTTSEELAIPTRAPLSPLRRSRIGRDRTARVRVLRFGNVTRRTPAPSRGAARRARW